MLAQLQAAPSGGRRIAPLWGADLKATSFGRGFFTDENFRVGRIDQKVEVDPIDWTTRRHF